jgi:hypothetical protein
MLSLPSLSSTIRLALSAGKDAIARRMAAATSVRSRLSISGRRPSAMWYPPRMGNCWMNARRAKSIAPTRSSSSSMVSLTACR